MAELPRVKIEYGNGALGQAVSSADGLLCLAVVGATEIAEKFALAKHYPLQAPSGLETLGVTQANNPLVYKIVNDFYKEAQEGTKTYIVGYPDTLHMSDILDKTKPYLRNVLELTKGEIRGFAVTKVASPDPEIENGMSSDVATSMFAAQMLGDWATETLNAPIFTVLDGVSYTGDPETLPDLKTFAYNRVGVVIGDTESGSANQAVGLIAGRIAVSAVQRNIARVKTGALNVLEMFAGDKPIELADVATIHGKRFITFRTFTGFSGYYIADDLLATKETDDYSQITRRRTIDKAYRIAYPTLVEELVDEIPVNEDGTMIETYATAFEQKVISAIATNMTAKGELSADPTDENDQGVKCLVDRTINILATSQIKATLRVRPFGYGKYIDVLLGFTVTSN
ncbi:MAG TPA: DUF2586 family protein [Dysgonomonas sp.]|uniref:DUF2586 family protein n=1 Tax=unclassified Dysgonomonas TaxID=2630389 RepID=UPI0025C10B3E|nr:MULTISPECIES: DUF2586 family protein [unclassified Dysgonomonas]HML64649.1 DUF2586 family protein [Dysgonomonas sp.]